MKRLFAALFALTALAVADAQNLRPITDSIGSLSVSIDPRMELLGAVQVVADYPYCMRNSTYSDRVQTYFGAFARHNAVKWTKKLRDYFGFSHSYPPSMMLFHSAPPELELLQPYPDYLKDRGCGEKNLQKYRKALCGFARESQFADFWMENEAFYRKIIDAFKREMRGIDVVRLLESYYRMRGDRYHVILGPLIGNYNYGPSVSNADGTTDIYALLGFFTEKEGLPAHDFYYALTLLLHEFSHSFVNPTTAKYSDKVMQYSALYEPLREWMCEQAYTNWMICVNEHIVRAVVIRLLEKVNWPEGAAVSLQDNLKNHFGYVPALLEKLKEYEALRDVGKVTFDEYMPTLLDAFEGAELSRP